ncbi:tyrosine-type recombinase/integrase [Sulfuriferula thiophila]|uniref:tyrosine-type recombinase/integrase n=1 Tax=Sulfuriferula thiophila TaxID=1781211 RepID=UPI000F60F6AC|nr:tyrosine-type recombinase/integrase [Sulfuriferula thiophila]
MKLTDLKVKNTKPTDKYQKLSDGGGLQLLIYPVRKNPKSSEDKPLPDLGGGKEWKFGYRFGGKQKTIALGTYPSLTLAEARIKRNEAKTLLSGGEDPSLYVTKKAKKAAVVQAHAVLQIAEDRLFHHVAVEYLDSQKAVHTDKHHKKLEGWLKNDVIPWIGKRAIDEISTPDMHGVMKRIEERGVISTAHCVLALCNRIFRFAVVTGKIDRNPCVDLQGALKPVQGKNFAHITEPKDIGELLRRIDTHRGTHVVRSALILLPLLFSRPGELRQMEWSELDLDAARWTIPKEKMRKGKREHVVLLSTQAVEIIKGMQPLTGELRYVFCGANDETKPMSDGAINNALRTLGYNTQEEITGHGFRHMASTLLNEMGFKGDLVEAQLSHKDKDKIRATYNHAKYLLERKVMMQVWSDYLYALKQGTDILEFKKVS